jgi:hypothetical protein
MPQVPETPYKGDEQKMEERLNSVPSWMWVLLVIVASGILAVSEVIAQYQQH